MKETGAQGNGSADDTNAIKAALQQAKNQGQSTVYVPAGTYMIRAGTYWNPTSTEIEIPAGMSMVGAGENETKLKVIPGSVINHAHQTAIVMHSNTRIADLTVDGSKSQVNRSGFGTVGFQGIRVQPWNTRNVTIENIRVHDIIGMNRESFGTMLNGVTGATLRNIEAYNVDGTGIHIDGDLYQGRASNVQLTNATVYNNEWAGVSVFGAHDIVVEGVTAYGNRLGGLNVEWSENIRFQDSNSSDNGFAGVVTNGKNENIQLVRLTLRNNEWSEVRLQENKYHAADPATGQVEVGVTGSMSVQDSTLQPRGGRPEFIIRTSSGDDDANAIFTFSGSGSGNWTVWNETS